MRRLYLTCWLKKNTEQNDICQWRWRELFLPNTMIKLKKCMNSSYLSVNDSHRTHYSHSLKILGSMKCSATIYTAIKLVHLNLKKWSFIYGFPWWLFLVHWAKQHHSWPSLCPAPLCPSPHCSSQKHLFRCLLDLTVLSKGVCQFEGNLGQHSALKCTKSMLT